MPLTTHQRFEALWLDKRYADALALAEQGVRDAQPESPAGAQARLDLAQACVAAGDPLRAETLQRDALDMLERLKNRAAAAPEDLESADLALFLAERLWPVAGDHPDVRGHLERALAIRQKRRGPRHPTVAEAAGKLAEFHYLAGRFAEAESLYRRALADLAPESAGPCVKGLAHTLAALARHAEADTLFARAIADAERPDGNVRDLYFLLIARAQGLDVLGRPDDAAALRERANALLPKTNPGASGYVPG